MEYRRLGKSGLKVSALSLGSWVTFHNQLDVSAAEQCMVEAYEAGVNFFDNAESYAHGQSEIIMGKILQRVKWPRDTFIVSSKAYWGSVKDPKPNQHGLSRKHVIEACHQALKRLQVDYLDLYYCHRPDRETPIEETVRAMETLIQQGKILYWGTSEWSAQQIMEAYSIARQFNMTPLTMEQPQYHMFHRERVEIEYARLYEEIGLGTTIWSPLASGLLTGKYHNVIPEDSRANLKDFEWLRKRFEGQEAQEQIRKVAELQPIASRLGTTMARLAIAWCLKNPNVSTVITGASHVAQVKENLQAIELVDRLDTTVMDQIEAVLENKPEQAEF